MAFVVSDDSAIAPLDPHTSEEIALGKAFLPLPYPPGFRVAARYHAQGPEFSGLLALTALAVVRVRGERGEVTSHC